MSNRTFSITSSSPWATSSVQPPRLAVSALGVHSDDQFAEVASFQHADKGFGRLLQTVDDVLAIANAAVRDAGSDLANVATTAVRVSDGWRLTGQKVWTSRAAYADWGICLARTDPEVPQHKGISYFLVDLRSEGIDVRPLREITG